MVVLHIYASFGCVPDGENIYTSSVVYVTNRKDSICRNDIYTYENSNHAICGVVVLVDEVAIIDAMVYSWSCVTTNI